MCSEISVRGKEYNSNIQTCYAWRKSAGIQLAPDGQNKTTEQNKTKQKHPCVMRETVFLSSYWFFELQAMKLDYLWSNSWTNNSLSVSSTKYFWNKLCRFLHFFCLFLQWKVCGILLNQLKKCWTLPSFQKHILGKERAINLHR